MPTASVRGAHIRYDTLGAGGPWVALSPGGRNGMDVIRPLAQRIADTGFRVLIHDRRNCGGSDLLLDGDEPEHVVWADDLHALLGDLGALPAHVGGGSSGCRLSLALVLRHPGAVRSLLLWRVTGGRWAAERLAEQYCGEYMRAAQSGGMAAVCATPHFAACIAVQPTHRDTLLATDPQRFVAALARWQEGFHHDADLPVIGASEAQLRTIQVPVCVVPGNDKRHPRAVGRSVRRFVPRAELHDLTKKDWDLDLCPPEEWQALEPALAAVLAGFLRRMDPPARR